MKYKKVTGVCQMKHPIGLSEHAFVSGLGIPCSLACHATGIADLTGIMLVVEWNESPESPQYFTDLIGLC